MGCANTKAGGATAYGAPEECPDGSDPAQAGTKEVPKVLVDGETPQDIAVNGNVVSNGLEEDVSGEEKEACNGDLAESAKEAEEDTTAPSTDTKSNNALNGAGGEEGSDRSSAQDGGQKADENSGDGEKEQSEADEKEAVTAESRDSQQEEADDKME